MDNWRLTHERRILVIGDVVILALTTGFGFANHGTLGSAGLRILATWVPLVVAWFLISPLMGVFDEARVRDPRQLWRPLWAMVLAAPMASFLRGVWLNQPILPLFVVVIGGFCALALVGWRVLYLLYRMRLTTSHG
jgi:hypothetical protein